MIEKNLNQINCNAANLRFVKISENKKMEIEISLHFHGILKNKTHVNISVFDVNDEYGKNDFYIFNDIPGAKVDEVLNWFYKLDLKTLNKKYGKYSKQGKNYANIINLREAV